MRGDCTLLFLNFWQIYSPTPSDIFISPPAHKIHGGISLDEDMYILARYPFLGPAREWVKGSGLTISQMLSGDHTNVQALARSRVERAIEGPGGDREAMSSLEESREHLLSYPLSRYIVATLGDGNLIKWFSHAEAEAAHGSLIHEDEGLIGEMGEELGLPEREPPASRDKEAPAIPRVTKGIRPGGSGPERVDHWVSFTDYLPLKRHISGAEWDLINQPITEGLIRLNRSRYLRLLQEAIKIRVEDGLAGKEGNIRGNPMEGTLNAIKVKLDARKKRYEAKDLGKITVTRLPPCIRQILGMSQAGENLPHHARFSLVTFLHSIGMSRENIFKSFARTPDFKEDIVQYQVDHITGASSATEYSVPSCETMKSGGICFNPDQLCEKEWMTHPMTYYKIKGKKGRSRPKDSVS